jgi:DNA modification methylase
VIVREERIGDQRLILGDCLAVMPLLGKVDAVVTDPPYGIAHLWAGQQSGKNGKSRLWTGDNAWDEATPIDPDAARHWIRRLEEIKTSIVNAQHAARS